MCHLISRRNGFTILELMIVVAIVAILATIAFPSYQRYVTKSRLEEGKAALAQNALWLDKMYNKNNGYQMTKGGAVITTNDLPFSQTGNGNNGYEFRLAESCNGTDGRSTETTFCLRAEPKSGQSNAAGGGKECGILMVDQSGQSKIKVNGTVLSSTTNDGVTCF